MTKKGYIQVQIKDSTYLKLLAMANEHNITVEKVIAHMVYEND